MFAPTWAAPVISPANLPGDGVGNNLHGDGVGNPHCDGMGNLHGDGRSLSLMAERFPTGMELVRRVMDIPVKLQRGKQLIMLIQLRAIADAQSLIRSTRGLMSERSVS